MGDASRPSEQEDLRHPGEILGRHVSAGAKSRNSVMHLKQNGEKSQKAQNGQAYSDIACDTTWN